MAVVLIADGEPVQRLLLRESLALEPTLIFVEVEDGSQVIPTAQACHPDVILLDVRMPRIDGLVCGRMVTLFYRPVHLGESL